MCIRPIFLPEGVQVPCRICGNCKDNHVRDWVGRCKAEAVTSQHSVIATLTYGMDDRYGGVEDNLHAKMLHYDDVRLWLQLMRKWTNRGPNGEVIPGENQNVLRYFAVGEYGSAKGRAHWHVLLFFKGQIMPTIKLSPPGREKVRFFHRHQKGGYMWPYGFSQFQLMDEGSAKYALKYLSKGDLLSNEDKRVGLSTKPPLGDAYFKMLAQDHVQAGLSPQTCKYRLPNERNRDGTPVEYYLGGTAIYNFLDHFAALWRAKHGKENWPFSELMCEYEEERFNRAQEGEFNWRDNADYREMRKLERQGKWQDVAAIAEARTPSEGPVISTVTGRDLRDLERDRS